MLVAAAVFIAIVSFWLWVIFATWGWLGLGTFAVSAAVVSTVINWALFFLLDC
jgi:hypothetical protein